MSQSSNHLRLVSWTWQWIHFTQMASTVTRSQSNWAPLGCGGTGDSHHGCAADKSAATAWCYKVNMDQNLWGLFPTPCSTDLRMSGGHLGMDESTSSTAQPGKDWASCLPTLQHDFTIQLSSSTITPLSMQHNFLSRPLSFLDWTTAMLLWLDFHQAQSNTYTYIHIYIYIYTHTIKCCAN